MSVSSRFNISRNAIFAALLGASFLALFLPTWLTNPLKHIVQFLVPAQDLSRTGAVYAARAVRETGGGPLETGSEGALERELAATQALVLQLEGELQRLRALRESQLPPAIPLLDAKVVGHDVAGWRESALVSRGSLRGVSWRDWVASRFFVNRGAASEVESGQAVLARETLVGRVEQVSPYMSRVQLLSDIDSPRIEVRIASVSGERATLIDYACSLRGMGRGRMAIENVESKLIQTSEGDEAEGAGARQKIRVGDLVYSAPGQLGLPVPMAVGKIVDVTENPTKRLVSTLVVEPLVTIVDVRDVFIIPIVPVETLRIP